ncbi:MAG: hypothetical protein HOC74_36865 [Gemmatimonadetes bacterium]|nr:hypothetical protein [Gemmatimonadota bacterium]
MSSQVVLEFSVDLPEEGLQDPEVLQKGRTAVILELLRKGSISQGRAAEVLAIDRYSLFDLMKKNEIPAIELTDEELKQELYRPLGREGSINDDSR